jgi:hypothetical protein
MGLRKSPNTHPIMSAIGETRKKKKIECKPELIISSLHTFYSTCPYIDKIMPYLVGDTTISLRLIDWFVTNYCRKFFVGYPLNGQEFLVYLSYKSQLRAYSKQLFDPNCRRERILFEIPGREPFLTTVGKLNFFRWAFESNVLQYIEDNLETIEKEREADKKATRRSETESSTDSNVSTTSLALSELSISTAPIMEDDTFIASKPTITVAQPLRGSTRRRRIKSIPTLTCHIQRYDSEVQLTFN